MQNILLKIGIIIGVSFVSAFVASTGIAMMVGFLIYGVLTDRLRHLPEILNGKFVLAAIFGWPLGLVGGIIGGLAGWFIVWFVGWLRASDVSKTNWPIVTGSVIGGLLGGLFSGFFIGINTIT